MVYSPESVSRRIAKLGEYGADLNGTLPKTFAEYNSQRTVKYAVERLLLLIAETILDVLDHILAATYDVVSDNYEDILSRSRERGLLSEELYQELRGLGGFRNVLAHEYLALRDEQVFAHARKLLRNLPQIRAELTQAAPPAGTA